MAYIGEIKYVDLPAVINKIIKKKKKFELLIFFEFNKKVAIVEP